MDCSVVDGDQPDRRHNILAATGNTSHQSAARCVTIAPVLHNAFLAKELGRAGRRHVGRLSTGHALFGAGYPWVLESWPGKLVTYKWLERVLCSFL